MGSRSTPSRSAARTHGLGPSGSAATGGAVSRMNRSIAAITAAASSGVAEEPRNSSRGRRFMVRSLPAPVNRIAAMPKLLVLACLLALAVASSALADTTRDHTLAPSGSGFAALKQAKGEKWVVRRGGGAKAAKKRAGRRRSLVMFAQLTDPQIADEMSPARVDFADPAGGELKSSWRPQEALSLQVFDSIVRNVNANRRSELKQGNGRKAKLAFALTTG